MTTISLISPAVNDKRAVKEIYCEQTFQLYMAAQQTSLKLQFIFLHAIL